MTDSAGTGADPPFFVHSPDGVPIAVWVGGDGPPIVLVHGSFGDHTAWAVPLGELRRHFTTYAMDRRGFGASGDGPVYAIERDWDDVAAVVETAANRCGEPVVVWGHSYGANCAMGGANISSNVSRLVLYEPSLGLTYPAGVIDAADADLATGDRESVLQRMLFDVLDMSRSEIGELKASPRWPTLLAHAHTAPREGRVEQDWTYRPGQFAEITAPTLMLAGSESPKPVVEATQRATEAIPNVTLQVLDGHGHFAHRTDPALVVEMIRVFTGA